MLDLRQRAADGPSALPLLLCCCKPVQRHAAPVASECATRFLVANPLPPSCAFLLAACPAAPSGSGGASAGEQRSAGPEGVPVLPDWVRNRGELDTGSRGTIGVVDAGIAGSSFAHADAPPARNWYSVCRRLQCHRFCCALFPAAWRDPPPAFCAWFPVACRRQEGPA